MTYQFLSDLDMDEFDAFASHHPLKNIFQSSKWATIKKEWQAIFTGVKSDEELVAVSLVLIRRLPLGFTLFYLPRGPLLDYDNTELLSFYFNHLKSLSKKYRAISIKIDPNVLLSSTPYKNITNAEQINTNVIGQLQTLGFHHFGYNKDMNSTSQPRYAASYYYKDSLDEHLKTSASYKKIQKAIKYGVYTEKISIEQLDDFCRLMQMTESRKNVSLRNKEYFKRLMEVYQEDTLVLISKLNLNQHLKNSLSEKKILEQQLQSIENKGKQTKNILNQLNALENEIKRTEEYIATDGEIIDISCSLALTDHHNCELLYAGMNNQYKRYYGTYYSNYIRMKWGQENNCIKCNFGGIPGTLDDGLTEFKTSFGVTIDEWIGEFDLPVNRIIYPIFMKLLPLAKKFFKFIAKKRRTS